MLGLKEGWLVLGLKEGRQGCCEFFNLFGELSKVPVTLNQIMMSIVNIVLKDSTGLIIS